MDTTCDDNKFSEVEADYVAVKMKVCELCLARGVVRPLRSGQDGKSESRAQAVKKSLDTVAALKGTVPPRLSAWANHAAATGSGVVLSLSLEP